MRTIAFRIAVFLVLSVAATQADAGVFERDWKIPGDGMLTYDDVNKRVWLDLSQTLLSSQFPGADREAKYQYVVQQTAEGGLFEGFTVGKAPDVIDLAQSAGIDTSTDNYATNRLPTLALQELLSITLGPGIGNNNTFSIGLLDETAGMPAPFRLGAIFHIIFTNQAGLALRDPARFLETNSGTAVMLYRVIPEPSTFLLTVSYFCLTIFRI
jgi:hypothetical protein